MKAWLYAGAGLALAVGLALGVFMRPRLAGGAADIPQPPVQAPAAARLPAPAADESRALARYGDKLPDYVLGADFKRLASAAAGPSTPILPDPQNYYVSPLERAPPADPAATGAAVDASAIATADGGPPITLPIVDNEATPEAAGDTRLDGQALN